MSDNFDVVVIGGGPGGYVCAIRAAQLGLKAAIVEKRGSLGGTCLNVGCIPAKALLQSTHLYEMAAHEMADHGIKVTPKLDLDKMIDRKEAVVKQLTSGVEFLMKKNKVKYIVGEGKVTGEDEVTVSLNDGGEEIVKAENIVIATGSDVATLPFLEIDEKVMMSSTGAMELRKVPKKMAVIGGGVIGLELGSVWSRLGTEVTVIEFLDGILPGMDGEIRKTAKRLLEKQGINFKLATKVTAAKKTKTSVTLTMEPAEGGESETLKADACLVSIGRRPYTDNLGLAQVGVEMDERGFVKVDHDLQTNVAGIFAIGDVIGGMMLAHKAEEEGVAVAEMLAGQTGHVNYDVIPGIVYTHPEIASVGKSEEALKEAGIAYKKGKFPFTANGRALANGDAEGFVKILADKETDRVLGCHIIGPQGGDLIQEVVQAMEFGGSAEDIARTCHGHPGLPEAVKEAAMAVDKLQIHA
ncbi:dihydrolipoyl dehydrogenase [Terasakiella sp. A23]|uniref:dihydrolipoyl dehydrogenase n=1 Tax=Terasakiella sp. FCG-A23 TaxID=3080561 RepID=UPI002952C883|nr:dihydrolipoyl dehydrogenase [Terasakiella sp. A23]MDV7338078.1 dihydrolipoyl dehydrogenase [Terasakiella sp. A23]